MPFHVERMDHIGAATASTGPPANSNSASTPDIPPSELFQRHLGCFIDDNVGLRLRHDIGIDKIMFEADFPDDDSHWPTTRTDAAKALADIPDHEVKQIVEDNAETSSTFLPNRTLATPAEHPRADAKEDGLSPRRDQAESSPGQGSITH